MPAFLLEPGVCAHSKECCVVSQGKPWALILSWASVLGNTSHAWAQLAAGRTQGSMWFYWERTVRSLLQSLARAPDPFARFALYPSSVINYSHDYNCMTSSENH